MSPSDECAEKATVGYVYALEKQLASYRNEINSWKAIVAWVAIIGFATGATIGILMGWLAR